MRAQISWLNPNAYYPRKGLQRLLNDFQGSYGKLMRFDEFLFKYAGLSQWEIERLCGPFDLESLALRGQ